MVAQGFKKACRFRQAFFAIAVLFLGGCAGETILDSRQDIADRIAGSVQMKEVRFRSGPFELLGYRHYSQEADGSLSVYIEGDGLAWNVFGTAPSRDPTPRDPVALRLAAAELATNRLFLARPCQYQTDAALSQCSNLYWTNRRFSEEVVVAFADIVKREAGLIGARNIRLVGYSGGGTLGALVAPRLLGAVELVTVAAPLDHAFWTDVMRISPMTGSLNPADIGSRLAAIPQVHIISTRDDIVPETVMFSYMKAIGSVDGVPVRIVRTDKADHHCCWQDIWAELLKKAEPPV